MATVTSALGPASGAAWDTDGYVLRRGAGGPRHLRGGARPRRGRVAAAPRSRGRGRSAQPGPRTCSTPPCEVTSSHLVVTAARRRRDDRGPRRPGPIARGSGAVLHLALTDATLASGCPWAVPGSHTRRRATRAPRRRRRPGAARAGDAVLLDGAPRPAGHRQPLGRRHRGPGRRLPPRRRVDRGAWTPSPTARSRSSPSGPTPTPSTCRTRPAERWRSTPSGATRW